MFCRNKAGYGHWLRTAAYGFSGVAAVGAADIVVVLKILRFRGQYGYVVIERELTQFKLDARFARSQVCIAASPACRVTPMLGRLAPCGDPQLG